MFGSVVIQLGSSMTLYRSLPAVVESPLSCVFVLAVRWLPRHLSWCDGLLLGRVDGTSTLDALL